jgi:hypothetical protein
MALKKITNISATLVDILSETCIRKSNDILLDGEFEKLEKEWFRTHKFPKEEEIRVSPPIDREPM